VNVDAIKRTRLRIYQHYNAAFGHTSERLQQADVFFGETIILCLQAS